MARPSKPWYWKARKTWCVYHKGERVHLGPDRAESLRQYHETMAKPQQKRQPAPGGSVVAILDDFLTWTEENRAPKTYTRYRDFIQSFASKGVSHGLIQSIRHRDSCLVVATDPSRNAGRGPELCSSAAGCLSFPPPGALPGIPGLRIMD